MTNCITRNYHAHGGSEWVIGGKLTFLPGATVEGAEGLFDLPSASTPAKPDDPLHRRQRSHDRRRTEG